MGLCKPKMQTPPGPGTLGLWETFGQRALIDSTRKACMDLEARGISYAAHSAVGEKLLPLPRPKRAVATRRQRWAHMGCQRLLRRAEGTEGRVDEGWRGLQHCLRASWLCREGRGTRTGKHPTASPPSCKGPRGVACNGWCLERSTFKHHGLIRRANGTGWSPLPLQQAAPGTGYAKRGSKQPAAPATQRESCWSWHLSREKQSKTK